jgi:hypothetical protein
MTPEQARAIARYQDAEHRIAVALRTASAERIVEIAQRLEVIADDSCDFAVGDRVRDIDDGDIGTVAEAHADHLTIAWDEGTLTKWRRSGARYHICKVPR